MVVITAIAAVGVTVAGAVGVTLAAGSLTAFAVGLGTQLALGFALNALSPKPSIGGISGSAGQGGYQVNSFGSALDHQIIYGKTRVGGAIVYDNVTGTNNKNLHRVIAFAGHEIDSFNEIYIDDELATIDDSGNVTSPSRFSGKLRIKEHLGTTDQAADSDLVSEVAEWTSNHRLRGIAYLYVRLTFDADVFPNGVPTITSTIKGKRVYDPRTDTTVWSDNPALCTRDYISSDSYGLGEADANIDDDTVTIAANACENLNYPTLSGGTRFTCNGAFTTAITPYNLFGDVLTSMGGLLWYSQGEWRMKPAYYTAPAIAFNENDLRSSINLSTRQSRRDNFNTVKGTFRGAETNWQVTDYPEVTNAAFVTADGGEESVVDINLPFTSDSTIARRIARIALERNRQQLTVGASFGMRAFQVQTGDIITLTNTRFGWTDKEFEVSSWTFGLVDGYDLQVQMILREISESVFDEVSDGVIYERDNTTLLSPFEVPSLGINTVSTTQVFREKLTNIVNVTITSGRPEGIDYVEVEFKESSSTEYTSLGTGEIGVYRAVDLETGSYDFRARAVNTFGVKGEWVEANGIIADGLLQPPSDVTNFFGEVNGAVITLEWDAVPDLDLSYYKIRYSSDEVAATWANSITASEKVPRPATSVTLPSRSGTFLIKAVDKSGVESNSATSIVVSGTDVESFTTTLLQTEDPTFDGDKTNCIVVNDRLRIGSVDNFDSLSGNLDSLQGEWDILGVNSIGTSATYLFSDAIDTGSVRRSRVRVDIATNRFDSSAGLFDDITGNIDLLPGNFDSLTGDPDFADTNVKAFVSTTNDDPLETPSWSSYKPLKVADISARAFRFKIDLEAQTSGLSPEVLDLRAAVQYN